MFLFSKRLFSLLSYCFWNCFLCFIFHAFIYLHILLTTILARYLVCIFLPWNRLLHLFILPPCISFSSPLFFGHTSSHAFENPSLKYPHKFGTPTLTNLTTFSSNGLLIFTIFSKLIFLFSPYMSFSLNSFLSSYPYLLSLMHVKTPEGLLSRFA